MKTPLFFLNYVPGFNENQFQFATLQFQLLSKKVYTYFIKVLSLRLFHKNTVT